MKQPSHLLTSAAINFAIEAATFGLVHRSTPELMESEWRKHLDEMVGQGLIFLEDYNRAPRWDEIRPGFTVYLTPDKP